jgi:hypothetical protein
MRRRHPVLIVLSVLIAAGLLCAGSFAQTAASGSPSHALRRTPAPTRTPQPTPSPTATPTPPATCWSTVPAPTLPGYAATLNDVAGSGASDVWAVGEYIDAGIGHTLILHWDGSTWQRVASPDLVTNGTVNSTTNELNGVAVIGPGDAWAVGYGVSSNVPYGTITEHWNGSSWQIVPSPNNSTPGFYNALNAVSAVSSSDVWAVGGVPTGFGAIAGRSLLMHWNGASWQLLPEPPETLSWSQTTRFGVTARSSNDVWAVGKFDAWHWDGSAWHDVPGSGQNLSDIDANGTALWSVGTVPGGYVEGSYSPPLPDAQYQNGTTWSSTSPVVNDHTNGAGFNAVKVISSGNVWAVGRTGRFALTEQWNGTAWTVVGAAQGNPSPSTSGNVLLGVTAFSQTAIWSVGYYYDSAGVQRVLIERYTCH